MRREGKSQANKALFSSGSATPVPSRRAAGGSIRGFESGLEKPILHAQAAVEVLAYAAFFLLIFVTTVAVFFQQQSQGLARAENAYAQEISHGFSDQIHTAFVAGPGFWQKFSIPKSLLGKPYRISISFAPTPASKETGFVYVDWKGPSGDTVFSSPTITTDYGATQTSDGFISVNATTGRITMDSAKGSALCMRNMVESGKNLIKIGPASSCP